VGKQAEKRRPGRPPSVGGGKGAEEFMGIRAPVDLVKRIDKWRKAEADKPGKAEAVRRLLDAGLKAAGF
jgi:hypothetical protein